MSVIKYFIVLLFSFSPIIASSQILIDYPVERQVIQRNNGNMGTIQIAGNLNDRADKIEARLVPFETNQGQITNWQLIKNIHSFGTFQGTIEGMGGWYSLEVRAFKNNLLIASNVINRVGIGEVFLISGQSNAEGNSIYEGAELGSTEDRVSVLNYQNIVMDENKMPFVFSPLKDNSRIGPYNPVPWFWAKFAEKLVQKYNVPVLLFGAAIGGISSELWYDSMKGKDFTSQFGSHIKFIGSPYAIIERTLTNYVSRTGIRAMLWQQGESDVYTPASLYISRMEEIIAQTSINIDDNLSWIMARSSRSPNITQIAGAQTQLIENLPNVYPGPNTDNIAAPDDRADGIHFHKNGLVKAAEAWYNAIVDENLLSNIKPVMPKPFIQILSKCPVKEGVISLGISQQFTQIEWNNGSKLNEINVAGGQYTVKAKKNGVVYFSPSFKIDASEFKISSISINGNTTYCLNDSSNSLEAIGELQAWNTGERSKKITPQLDGIYFYTRKNYYGCLVNSERISIKVLPLPIPEIISSNGVFAKCEGDTIQLSTSKFFNAYIWNNSSSDKKIYVLNSGENTLTVKDNNGCYSEKLAINITEIPKMTEPVLTKTSPFTLTTNAVSGNSSFVWFKDGKLLENNKYFFQVTEPGFYKIQRQDLFILENKKELYCKTGYSQDIEFTKEAFRPPIAFWPNPVINFLNIESPSISDVYIYSIFDNLGRTVKNGTLNISKEKISINLEDFITGIYYIKIGNRSNFLTHQFLKE